MLAWLLCDGGRAAGVVDRRVTGALGVVDFLSLNKLGEHGFAVEPRNEGVALAGLHKALFGKEDARRLRHEERHEEEDDGDEANAGPE